MHETALLGILPEMTQKGRGHKIDEKNNGDHLEICLAGTDMGAAGHWQMKWLKRGCLKWVRKGLV